MDIKKYFFLLIFLPAFAYGGICENFFKSLIHPKPSLEALSKALESPENLQKHLSAYSVNARSLETGDTLLHLAVKNFRKNYIPLGNKILFRKDGTYRKEAIKKYIIGKLEQHQIIEELLLLSANTNVSNHLGHRVINSYYFQIFVRKNFEFKPNVPSIYLKLRDIINKKYPADPIPMKPIAVDIDFT